MPLILLLDLDNTLLENDVNVFVSVYLKVLGNHIEQASSDLIRRQIMIATQAMTAKDTPALTLEEVFDHSFYPGIGIDKADVWDSVQNFYEQVFPTLKSVTAARPAAKRLVEYGFENSHKVVVATNPLFPLTATLQVATFSYPQQDYLALSLRSGQQLRNFSLCKTATGILYRDPGATGMAAAPGSDDRQQSGG